MAVLPRRSTQWSAQGEGAEAMLIDLTTGTVHPDTSTAAALIDLCDGQTSVTEAAVMLGRSPMDIELSLHTLADLGALSFGSAPRWAVAG